MSKKTLLKENTVRQFMKYANIGGLSDKFINENYMAEDEHEKEVEEGMYYEEELGGAVLGDKATGDGIMEEEPGMEDMGDDMEMDDSDMEMDDSDMEMDDEASSQELPPEAISALEQAVEAAADAMLQALAPFGVEGEASVEGEEDMSAMGDEPPTGDEDMGDMGAGDPMDDMEMDDGDMMEMLDDEEVVQETMKRVMKRLRVMKEGKRTRAKKSQMIDSVADAIVARLRKKK